VNTDEFFLRTLNDLASRLLPPQDDYDLLKASALIRLLLLDERPLAEQVNESRRMKIHYAVADKALPVDRGTCRHPPTGSSDSGSSRRLRRVPNPPRSP
jgi:hypothetical protein